MGFELAGLDKLQRRLDRLGAELSGPAEERMVRAGAKVYKRKLQERAPVLTPEEAGKTSLEPQAIRKSIGTRVRRTKNGAEARIGPRGNGVRLIAYDVEYGHQSVVHDKAVGQVPPHPFIRPTFEEGRSEVQEAMIAEVDAMIRESGNE